MKISELATASEVSAKTIRYYEQIGLISPARRNDSGYRQYSDKDVTALIFIRRCRELNIGIDNIRQLLEAQLNPQSSCRFVDEIIEQQLKRIQQKQTELAMLEKTLSSLAASCNNHKVEDCSILHQLSSD
ncbi:MerR family transcriptional regulator [Alteromonas sp. H39]|uniref:MerR family transcriptional regulator n=1 Tax=Alteromonas sp. H39 TaxID=3389876 RepID=UPI0039DF68ED